MPHSRALVPLGFTDEHVPVGTHLCLVFTTEEERVDSLLKFLLAGLRAGERTACFSGKLTEDALRGFLAQHGISYDERNDEKAVMLAGTSEVYFEGGVFDPERMLHTLLNYHEEALRLGFPAARVIGEMIPEVQSVPGGERLLEYESRVTMLLRDHPVTSVCQYDANAFDGATIMNVLKVHPQMVVNGSVINNPFYIEPEIYLRDETSRHADY